MTKLTKSRPRRVAPIVAAALVAVGVGATPASAAPAPDVSTAASADAYVAEAAPTVAKGTTDAQNCFVNDDAGTRQRCLLSFTVTGLGAGDSVTAAKILVMDKGNATGSKLVDVYPVTGTWTESAVTWNTQPALGPVVGSATAHAFNVDSVFPLAAGTITANGTYQFALGSPPGSYPTGMNFYPKENTAGKPGPRLVLSVDHVNRFPGDPGVGKFVTGLNSNAQYDAVQAGMPARFLVRRSYNGLNFGVPMSAVNEDVAVNRIPMVSWKLAPYTLTTVPMAAIHQVCTNLKSVAPHPVFATGIFHEPEDDFPSATDAANFRTLFRLQVQTCRGDGVTNVAWVSPFFQAPYTFGTSSGRDPRFWNPDWRGTTTAGNPAADYFTGTSSVIDMDGLDFYVSRSIDSRPLATQWSLVQAKWAAQGYTHKPVLIGELGIHASYPDDTTFRTREMSNAWNNVLRGNPDFVGAAWWATGGESFCSGPDPTQDPGCGAQNILASIVADPLVIHP